MHSVNSIQRYTQQLIAMIMSILIMLTSQTCFKASAQSLYEPIGHFFECKCARHETCVADPNLIWYITQLYHMMGCTAVTVSSSYRCPEHDKAVGGNGSGYHTKGKAVDICFYTPEGPVDARIVCILAAELDVRGVANINQNYQYVHLDTREVGLYYGDEWVVGNGCIWNQPGPDGMVHYSFCEYFGITPEEAHSYIVNPLPDDTAEQAVTELTYVSITTAISSETVTSMPATELTSEPTTEMTTAATTTSATETAEITETTTATTEYTSANTTAESSFPETDTVASSDACLTADQTEHLTTVSSGSAEMTPATTDETIQHTTSETTAALTSETTTATAAAIETTTLISDSEQPAVSVIHQVYFYNTYTAANKISYSRDMTDGEIFGTLPDPDEIPGYRFKGWFSSAEGGELLTPDSKAPDDEVSVYFAHFTLLGDLNANGKVTAADAVLLYRVIAEDQTLTAADLSAADLNGDGSVTMLDAACLLRRLTMT